MWATNCGNITKLRAIGLAIAAYGCSGCYSGGGIGGSCGGGGSRYGREGSEGVHKKARRL